MTTTTVNITSPCKSKGRTDRIGLYLLVLMLLMRSCDLELKEDKIIEHLDRIEAMQK